MPYSNNIIDFVDTSIDPIGSLISVPCKPAISVDNKWLYCDGTLINQTDYPDLYTFTGDNLSSGTPWKQQYSFNTSQSTDITGWGAKGTLPGILGYSQAVVTNSRVYLLGGTTGTRVSTVYTAPINADGTLGTWTTGTSLPIAVMLSHAVIIQSFVYLLGGEISSGAISTIYRANINLDGTLGPWTNVGNLPSVLKGAQDVIIGKRLYLLGGNNTTIFSTIINSDGTLGTWTTSTSLPGIVGNSQAIVTNSRVYLLGGHNGSSYVSTVYTAPINPDGTLGTWTTSTSLPGVLGYSQAIVTNSRVYLLGGYNGSAFTSIVYTAPINSDGTLGTWTTGTALPGILGNSQAITTSAYIYMLGGVNDLGVNVDTIYRAPFTGGLNNYSNSGKLILPNIPNTLIKAKK